MAGCETHIPDTNEVEVFFTDSPAEAVAESERSVAMSDANARLATDLQIHIREIRTGSVDADGFDAYLAERGSDA